MTHADEMRKLTAQFITKKTDKIIATNSFSLCIESIETKIRMAAEVGGNTCTHNLDTFGEGVAKELKFLMTKQERAELIKNYLEGYGYEVSILTNHNVKVTW